MPRARGERHELIVRSFHLPWKHSEPAIPNPTPLSLVLVQRQAARDALSVLRTIHGIVVRRPHPTFMALLDRSNCNWIIEVLDPPCKDQPLIPTVEISSPKVSHLELT